MLKPNCGLNYSSPYSIVKRAYSIIQKKQDELKGSFVQKFAELERRRKLNEAKCDTKEVKYLEPVEHLDLYKFKVDYMELMQLRWQDNFHELRQEFEEKYQGVTGKVFLQNYYDNRPLFYQTLNESIDKHESELFEHAEPMQKALQTTKDVVDRTNYLFMSDSPNDFNNAAKNFNPSIRDAITLKQLMAASMHIGHTVETYHRSMGNCILGEREGIHIIDLEKTLAALRRAIMVVKQTAKMGGRILFIGSRPLIKRLVYECAVKSDQYFVNEQWKQGILTNAERFNGSWTLPDLIVCLSYSVDKTAVLEANKLYIPSIAICDTDCDMSLVTYPIPCNDDALTAVSVVGHSLAFAACEGKSILHDEKTAAPLPFGIYNDLHQRYKAAQ